MTSLAFSLRWKVALSVSLLLIAVTGAVAVALIRYERMFLTQEGTKRVQSLAQHLAINARDPLLVGDDLRLGPITQSVMRGDDTLYAYLVNHLGQVAYHPDGRLIGAAYPDELQAPVKGVLEAVVPVTVESTEVGKAVVGLSAAFVADAMRATALGLLIPLGTGTLIGVAGIFLLTGLHVKRLERLEQAVRALGAGDLRVQAEVGGHDEVARLSLHFNSMVMQLQRARREIERGFTETVSALAAAIEAKDEYTRGHCERVARISLAIAERLGVNDAELKNLELAAILHDVGKIGVSAKIIGKTGRLNAAEMERMQEHPDIGARILSPLSFLGNVVTYVRHHHEHYDGSGYPAGLTGDEIPLPDRIIHLVDAYDAMTTSRPYRSGLSHDEALARIAADKGRQFDPHIVELFLQLDREGVVAAIREEVAETEAA